MSRSIQRRIIYHGGPTNSGKTHAALERLKMSKKGLYCAPLRLLAMEIYDVLNRDGIYCNLKTGQERKSVPGAKHSSVTVEMIDIQERYDVAVIDEIQLIGDPERAYAWTRALHGLAANELHLCGDQSALQLIRTICADMKEEIAVLYYQRLTPLYIDPHTLSSYDRVEPGDCVVAFSRQDIYDIKSAIEYFKGYRVAVVYGALPPEVRQQQATLFNTPGNGYEVMVASDAVGMGLNLNIKRIVFHALTKFDGEGLTDLAVTQIKQISGRAGRKSSLYSKGKVTCLNPWDLPFAKAALKLPSRKLRTNRAGIFPELGHILKIAEQYQTSDINDLMERIRVECKIDEKKYFLCKQTSFCKIAKAIESVPLSIRDRLLFCLAPVSATSEEVLSALIEYATVYSKGLPVSCRLALPDTTPVFHVQLKRLEIAYEIASLWMWLSFRFGQEYFPTRKTTEKHLRTINTLFETGLRRMSIVSLITQDANSQFPVSQRERHAKELLPPAAPL